MGKESCSHTIRVKLCTNTGLDIVIHFNIPHSVLIDNPVYYFIDMINDSRVTEIELIPASVKDSLSMTDEKPVIGSILCLLAVDTHNLQLKPDTGNHSLAADIISYFFDSARETFSGFLPFANAVPPESRCIPAGINNIILTTRLCCRINQRQLLFCGRISEKAVHIIIKDNRQILIILIYSADHTAILRKLPNGLRKISI